MSCPCPHRRNPALLLQLLRTGSSFSFGPLVPRQAKQHRVASSSSRAPSQSSFGERLSTWVGAKPAAGLPAAGTSLCLALGPELCSSVSLPWDISCPAAFGEGMPRATLVLRISLQHSQPMGAAGGMQPIPPLLHSPGAGAVCPLAHLALWGCPGPISAPFMGSSWGSHLLTEHCPAAPCPVGRGLRSGAKQSSPASAEPASHIALYPGMLLQRETQGAAPARHSQSGLSILMW